MNITNEIIKYLKNPNNINILDNINDIEIKINYINQFMLYDYTMKKYKNEIYYLLLKYVCNHIIIIYNDNYIDIIYKQKLDKNIYDSLFLNKLTIFNKGQILLKKFQFRLSKIINENQIYTYLKLAASYGTIATYLYWYKYLVDHYILNNLNYDFQINLIVESIKNPDNRLYKYLLDSIVSKNKILIQYNIDLVNKLIFLLYKSNIPYKYFLQRLKLLSKYINLIPYFNYMIFCIDDIKYILDLHKYYYNISHNINILYDIIKKNNIDFYILNIINIFKTEEEKNILIILYSIIKNKIININYKSKIFENIIINNYKFIIKELLDFYKWISFIESINTNNINKQILKILTDNNLITKYLYNVSINYIHPNTILINTTLNYLYPNILLFTRYLSLNIPLCIKINNLLFHLRLFIKYKKKIKFINYKFKMFNLLNEIKYFKPNKNIPVLFNGSYYYQLEKQKFNTNLPIQLSFNDINYNCNYLLRYKTNNLLTYYLPINIFPNNNIFNYYQVKAEYIEDIDLYLVYDINIPNYTIIERYEFLRYEFLKNIHDSTKNIKLQTITDFNQLINIFTNEQNLINTFLNNNKQYITKWFPKLNCLINNISFNSNKINILINSNKLYKCNGIILTPSNGDLEFEIK
jgi:hypothetical protein